MATKASRRFIAAATCPQCGKQDTLYFINEVGEDFACIECGYDSVQLAKAAKLAKATKLTGVTKETETVPIKLIDNSKNKKH